MATVELYWQKVSIGGVDEIHSCEIKARKDGDALAMEVHNRGRGLEDTTPLLPTTG